MFFRLADESGIIYPDLVLEKSGTCETSTGRLVKYEIFNPRKKIKGDSFSLRKIYDDVFYVACSVLPRGSGPESKGDVKTLNCTKKNIQSARRGLI